MAEALREEGEDGEGQRRDLRDGGQTADHLERTKSEHLSSSQRPLSSIRAAIKRTRTNSQSGNNRERRRPEITIISAEPLANNNWFSGGSVVFSPSRPDWSAGTQAVSWPPPSYDQVIKEKTREEHIVKPIAAPRRTACTATSATQTDPVGEDVASHCGATPPPSERRPAGKKPQKPLRPSLPKGANRKPAAGRDKRVAQSPVAFANTEHQSDSESDIKQHQHTDNSHRCTRSVTVYWDITTTHRPATGVPSEITPSTSENSQRPIPRPRTKSLKQATEDKTRVDTLVKFSENSDTIYLDSQEFSTNECLKELLEVFSEGNECEESSNIFHRSDKSQGEDVVGEMNSNYNQRNIRARIQAFESQAGGEEGDVFKLAKPDPLSRRATIKPPVAAKPLIALNSRSVDDNQNIPTTQRPTPASQPQPPTKPVGLSVREELEALHNKRAIPLRPHPSVFTRDNSIHEEELSLFPPIPPAKPSKEPLKPNLNINNHNSAFMVTENEYVDSSSNNNAIKSQHNEDSGGGFFSRQSVVRRPTTIRVPSKTDLDLFQDSPPPIPVQKPVGSLNTIVPPKLSLQNSFSIGPEPSLPPRKPTVKKSLPPRPPAAKTGPGRTPPPSLQATSRSQSASWQPSPKSQAKKPQRKGLVLPPRPSPGHRLYNKYTLELPHGIATFDYNGSNTEDLSFQKDEVLVLLDKINHNEYECQVGEMRGRVHKSRMKIITPLGSYSSPLQGAGPAVSGGDANGLKVQAVHDFIQEGPEELGLRAGDVVTMVEQVDSQWYRGTCRGSTGFFPISYVKVLPNSPKPLPERKTKPQSAPVSGPRCVARFDFEGEHSNELSFSEGDVIQLKEYMGEDWARGQIGIAMGIFPLNYVEIIEDLPPPSSINKLGLPGMAAAASPSMQHEAGKPAQMPQPSVEWAVARYDYSANSEGDLSFQQGDCILITQHINEEWSCGRLNGREGMFPTAFVETTAEQKLSKNHQHGTASGQRARALYNFPSDCEEELTLQVGDVITNLESIDEEWFLGDLRGKRALVPKNYVQVLD